jgi:hypothetical protein
LRIAAIPEMQSTRRSVQADRGLNTATAVDLRLG